MADMEIEVFRRCGDDLVPLAAADWEAFCAGQLPLPDVGRGRETVRVKVDLLLVTRRDGVCELVEPISVHVDEHGFLQRLHVRFDALPAEPGVHDARGAFLSRYLRHANHWAVTESQLARAIGSGADRTRSGV